MKLDDYKLSVLKHGGRTTLRVELPPNSPPLTRQQKLKIKSQVRKVVRAEKLKAKKLVMLQEKHCE